METTQYKDLFISEGREILSRLNGQLVTLEKHPEDRECLNEIFREAHTLKGMAATMGYEEITRLTHEMEGALDLLRRGALKANKETVDLLFESCDALEALVGSVGLKKGNGAGRAAQSAAAKLEKLKGGPRKKETPVKEERRSNLRLEEEDRREIVKAASEGIATYRVTVSLKKECKLKEARAFMVAKALEEKGKVIRSEFLYKQLEQGKFGRHFGLFLITKEPPEALKEKVEAIQDVQSIVLKPLEVDEVISGERRADSGQRTAFNGKEKVASRESRVLRKGVSRESRVLSEDRSSAHHSGLTTQDSAQGTRTHETQMVRVALDRLDHLMNMVGELAINKIQLTRIGQLLQNKELSEALTQMGRLTDELQFETMEVRLVPMDYIFNRFPRLVRDSAAEEGKEVDLVVEGSEIGLDRTILDEINEPLVHLLRNAVSHGIETPEERKKLGKKAAGKIRLSARRERNFVVVEVADDGLGMDPSEIRKVAAQKGIISAEEASKLNDEEALTLITSPGFSTSKVVTQTSGRGVGMNTVRTKVESFGGSLKIQSTPGGGSTFTLKLPLTLAIVQALLVRVENETYAIPLVNIVETMKVETRTIRQVEHHEVVPYRETVLPLIRLKERLGFRADRAEQIADRGQSSIRHPEEPRRGDEGSRDPSQPSATQDDARSPLTAERSTLNAGNERLPVVVVEVGHRKAGLVADQFVGQQEVVIKTLKESLRNIKGAAGATILGDGRVAMILDVASLF